MNKKIMSTALITLLSSGLSVHAAELNNKIETQELNTREVILRSVERSVATGKVNTINLNMRKGPSTSYAVIKTIKENTTVSILETKDGWYKISAGNTTGWVNSKYITKVEAEKSSTKNGTVNTASLNVRKGPSVSYSVVTKVSKGDKVEIYETKNGWSKIKCGSKEGWVNSKYITVSTSTSNSTSTNSPTTTTKKGTVTTSNLNVRTGPSTSYKSLGSLAKNTKVDIYETKNDWHRIKYSGKDGWISGKYVTVSNTNTNTNTSTPSTSSKQGTIHTYDVTLRKTASYSGTSICVIKKGSKVDVLSVGSEWTKVKYNNNEGYVMTKYVTTSGNTTQNNTTQNNTTTEYKTGTVTTNGLNVRSGASTSFSVIGTLNKGDKVSVIKTESNGWHKVKLSNGKEGYVSGSYVTFGEVTNTGKHPVSKKKIAIDLGHQLAINAGAVGYKKEDTVIKEVGDRLISKLKANGYNVINVTPTSASSISNSLAQRASKANNAGADIFMSIHFNAASSSSAHGAEVFYATESGSTTLAKNILNEIVDLGFRNRGIKDGSHLGVLRQSKMTGVLIECAFVTNKADMNRYNPDTMANAIFNGLVNYLD